MTDSRAARVRSRLKGALTKGGSRGLTRAVDIERHMNRTVPTGTPKVKFTYLLLVVRLPGYLQVDPPPHARLSQRRPCTPSLPVAALGRVRMFARHPHTVHDAHTPRAVL